MISPADFDDIHSHDDRGPRILTNIFPGDEMFGRVGECHYSVGIHPWMTAETIPADQLAKLAEQAVDPRVDAIGEAGLDALRGGDMLYQEEIFKKQVAISEQLGKPMIIHCVRAFDRLLRLRKELRPSQLWIVHGFRGKPELARQLIAAGCAISLGKKFNPDVPEVVPAHLLFRETDNDSNLSL